MLSIEEIKKACEFAEGFEIKQYKIETCIITKTGYLHVLNKCGTRVGNSMNRFTLEVYPLFLQRVIEGINKHFLNNPNGWWIEDSLEYIETCRRDSPRLYEEHYYYIDNIDKAKEEAIRHILGKL